MMGTDNEDALKKYKSKIINGLDRSQTPAGSTDVEEAEDSIKDVPADKAWTEESEGTIAPKTKAGETEIDHTDDMRKRFALTHDFDLATLVTGKKSSGKHDFGKTDKPADTTPAEE